MAQKCFGGPMQLIKYAMEVEDVSQAELAKRVNVTESTVSRWLSGTRSPSLKMFDNMLTALNLKVTVHLPNTGQKE